MSKLEKIHFNDRNRPLKEGFSDLVIVEQGDGQFRFEQIEVNTYDTKAREYARLGGYALTSNAIFQGYKTKDNEVELSLRHDAKSDSSAQSNSRD